MLTLSNTRSLSQGLVTSPSGEGATVGNFPSANFNTAIPFAMRDVWPTSSSPVNGYIRNSNTPSSVNEVKAAILCDGLKVNGVWYAFSECIEDTDAGTDDLTTSYRLSSTSPFSGFSFDPDDTPLWDTTVFTDSQDEAAITTVIQHPWSSGLIAFLHGGNNTGPRKIYYATSPSPTGAPGTWTAGNGGDPIIESTEAYETNLIAGARAVYDLETNRIRCFYRSHDGADDSNVALATIDSAFTVTKVGVVIPASAWASVGGPVSGGVFVNAAGDYHMWVSAKDASGVRHARSTDKGANWTVTASDVISANGDNTTEDFVSVADGVSMFVDPAVPEIISLAVGSENTSGSFPDDTPVRGRNAWAVPWPRDLADINTPAKFHGDSGAAARSETTFSPTTSILNTSGFMIAADVRFQPAAADTTNNNIRRFRHLITAHAAFNISFYLRIDGDGTSTAGMLSAFYRTPSDLFTISSAARLDDGVNHRVSFEYTPLEVTKFVLRIDGVVDDSTTTDPGADATAALHAMGNWNSSTSNGNQPSCAAVKRMVYASGPPPGTSGSVDDLLDDGDVYAGGSIEFDSLTDGSEAGPVFNVEWQAS